ncbi:rho-related BTB domain-containing protein 1 [Agrilus planipennis]|uniref:Rho-related BTB domain-containing protein 1 n=1 Tax=Agrilus planipennis TaxID=224129 RepID=A0A1W4XP07_AGRPL|nr:rho-related BTB domain-containing protein 1 [Agrilus planipennis]
MDNEQPHQELVKCVVVGDTAVGKTRLICARACNQQVSLARLLATHVPTVWAIDQYRIYKDVLERSWDVVDSVNVSLRLWDTFGDHEKDRRFAYGRSDVVLLCFSINNPVSLRNCRLMWYPEIRRFCPNTPVLLVGCKNDLRFMYRDEAYLSFFRDRSPFVRATRKSDLVMPDEARDVARELGLYYYETSVLTYYGVNEVFENAIRAALIARRQQRFWQTNLKKVQRPLLQAPFKPPPPPKPEIKVGDSDYGDHLRYLWINRSHTDLVLVAGSVGFPVHRFVVASASPAFYRLLALELNADITRSTSDSSMVSSLGDFSDDTESLIRAEQRIWKRRASCQTLPPGRDLNHPAFQSIRSIQSEGQTVVTLGKMITPIAMKQCLQFMYTGMIDQRQVDFQEIRHAAEFLEISQLCDLLVDLQQGNAGASARQIHESCLKRKFQDVCLDQNLFADIVFELDDGACAAHKSMLAARCDVMKAMFSGDFRESQAKVIEFPGVREYTFHKLLCYMYTDDIPPVSASRCVNLLELANRLCLLRLVNLVEKRVIEDLEHMQNNETIEQCLRLLEPVKLHNAHQLADWCMNHLCVNYNKLCKMSPRSLRLLHPDNQAYLVEHRWPPVWYLKDYDYYQKCMVERERENRHTLKSNSGCLCFSRKAESDPALAGHF